jgi:pimeloyl-ACP methyl ester carboxylesterase
MTVKSCFGELKTAADWQGYLAALGHHAGIKTAGAAPPLVRFMRIGRLRFRYLDWGRENAPALVLLHGGGQSAHTWDAFCLLLSPRYRCLALDQRGSGDSDWPADAAYAIEDHAGDVAEFIDRTGVVEPLLVGMSMGGINATAYAAGHADRLRGLVSVDVGPQMQLEPVRRLMSSMGPMWTFASVAQAAEKLAKLGARRDQALLRQTLALNLRQRDDGQWIWKFDPGPLFGISTEELLGPRAELWGVLDRITCPVLVVRGGDSEVFAASDAEEFARRLPHAQIAVVPKARHSVQTDNPRGLADVIAGFDSALLRREIGRET